MSSEGPRVAVVTGASRGIGKITAALLASQGATTIGLSRHSVDSRESRQCDVRDEAQVDQVFRSLAEEHGRLDILINCAGAVDTAGPLDLKIEDWRRVLDTNLIGTYLCCKHAIPEMRRHKFGRIVNVSSIAGRSFSQTASLAYTCSKYGVVGLTRQLAQTFGRDGININCIAPSQTLTEMLSENVPGPRLDELAAANPLGRLADPAEIAKAICFLASEGASYINGAVMDVNGGQV